MSNPIVTINVNQQIAPTPNTLQRTGALISQGGTILSAQIDALLTQPADLTPLLPAALALTSLAWAGTYGGQVTATATVAHGVTIGEQFVTTIAGAVPVGYNGTVFAIATGSATFTYYLPVNPGSETTPGTYTPRGVGELQAMVNTFFAQGAQNACFVLELGAGEPAAGITALTSFITNSVQKFYSYLVPRNWDGVSAYLSFLAGFESTTSKTYFFTTTTLVNWPLYTAQMKDVLALVEAPIYGAWTANVLTAATWTGSIATLTTTTAHGIAPGEVFSITGCTPAGYNGTFVALPGTTGSTILYALTPNPGMISVEGTLVQSIYSSAGVPPAEFTNASVWWTTLNYAPGGLNKVTPLSSSELDGVTQFPQAGTAALTTTLQNANINFAGNGGEGGIVNTMLIGGNMMDGNPFNYWYAIDWMAVNGDLSISNAVINGSNNPAAPLDYNQNGINVLQQVLASVGSDAITFGLAIGSVSQVMLDPQPVQHNINAGLYAGNVVVNAVPFTTYSVANPGDYKIGQYKGLYISFVPARGFTRITININASQIA